jgi:hypothetical protein
MRTLMSDLPRKSSFQRARPSRMFAFLLCGTMGSARVCEIVSTSACKVHTTACSASSHGSFIRSGWLTKATVSREALAGMTKNEVPLGRTLQSD